MEFHDRLKSFIEHINLKPTSFEQEMGFSNGSVSSIINRKLSMKGDRIESILLKYPQLNALWFLTGEGEMINNEGVRSRGKVEGKVDIKYSSETLQKHLTPNKDTLREPTPLYNTNRIPLVFANAVGGWGNTDFAIGEADIKDFYVIPKFKDRKIDFMIEVSGSSMYPKYNSGDVVACRKIGESSFIQWNKVHVIATKEQGILIKRLKKHTEEDNLLAVSDNKDYEPFCIPKDEITGLAIVVGVIRLE